MAKDVEGYREFVAGRMDQLRRTAYVLSGDWHTADDLVSTTLVKLYRHWNRACTMDNPDAYARRILLRAWLDERRRPWRREHARQAVPDRPTAERGTDQVVDRMAMLGLLAELSPKRRAVLVLRYFCDLSVDEAAATLNCSPGTVKSQTARALQTLRARLGARALTPKEAEL